MSLPAILRESVCSTDIDVSSTGRINAIYYRNVAKRLVEVTGGVTRPDVEWRKVQWLPVEAVYGAHLELDAGSSDQLDGPATEADVEIAQGVGAPPPVIHITAAATPRWANYGLGVLGGKLSDLDMGGTVQFARGGRAAIHQVEVALDVLTEIWYEAGMEFRQLIHAMVYADGGGGLRSASLEETFGAIYVGRDLMRNVTSTIEMLLHETGHHAMYVRTAFLNFVENPEAVATHPLRQDPRPLSGILHAAFVLARICRGLLAWASLERDSEVEHRLSVNRGRLVDVLDVLEQHGQFTSDGAQLLRDMKSVADQSSGA